MKYRILDLLACPVDKSWPLELEIHEEITEKEKITPPKENPETGVVCAYYCHYKKIMLVEKDKDGNEIPKKKEEIEKVVKISDCEQCFQQEIISGNLICTNDTTHKYEIKDGIPIMLTLEQQKALNK